MPLAMDFGPGIYLTAAWSLRVLVQREWRMFPLMLLFTWWSVDGCYAVLWSIPEV